MKLAVSPESARRVDQVSSHSPEESTQRSWYMETRYKVYRLLDEPESSNVALYLANFLMIMIVLSTISFVLETEPSLKDPDTKTAAPFWRIFELICVSIFSLEYVLRVWSHRDRIACITNFQNIIDFLAISPSWIEYTAGSAVDLRFIRIIRIARVFRALKVSRYSLSVRVCLTAMAASWHSLVTLLITLCLTTVISATFINLLEPHRIGFTNILDSIWFIIQTVTIVGYGDVVVENWGARVVAILVMSISVMFVAIPISTVSGNFLILYRSERHRAEFSRLFQENIPMFALSQRKRNRSQHWDQMVSLVSSTPSFFRRNSGSEVASPVASPRLSDLVDLDKSTVNAKKTFMGTAEEISRNFEMDNPERSVDVPFTDIREKANHPFLGIPDSGNMPAPQLRTEMRRRREAVIRTFDSILRVEQVLCSVRARLYILDEGQVPDSSDPIVQSAILTRIDRLFHRLSDVEMRIQRMGVDLV